MKPCPVCDIDPGDPLFCLALGVALGHSHPDIHDVTEHMCKRHRTPYVMAMLKVSQTMQTLEAVDAASLSERDERKGNT